MITYFQYFVPFKIVQYICYGHAGLTYAHFFVLVVCLVSFVTGESWHFLV